MAGDRRPRRLWRAALALVALSTAAGAQQAPLVAPGVITVDGQASRDVVPDTAHLSIGIVAERPTAAAATADLARASQAVVDQIKAEGLADKDVMTGSIDLTPVYPDDTGRTPGQPRPPRAFRASTDLVLTVRPADRAGAVAAHLVDRGANTIEGLAFSSSHAVETLDALRAEAMRDARRKAEIYVGALGVKLGRIVEITPQNDNGPLLPVLRKSAAMATPVAEIPVAPGRLTLRSSVSVRWDLIE